MSDELEKKAFDEFRNVVEEGLKSIRERIDEEVGKLGEATGETKEAFEKINDRLDAQELAMQKRQLATGRQERDEKADALLDWLRKGDRAPAETKASLQIDDDTAGGFLAPAQYVRELLKGVIEYSPVRELATVTEISATSAKFPKRAGTFAATWTGSATTRTETTGLQFGMEEISAHELYALVDVENQLLEDEVFDLEQMLGEEFSEQFGLAEGTAFVNGDSVKKPEGILQNASISTVTSTSNDALHGDDFAKVLYQLKEPYHPRASWLLNRLTVRDARLLKDTTNQYLWQPALAADLPSTILGKPYRMATDMPVVADAAKAIVVGDFKKGYRIVDRVVMSIQRDPYTQNTVGATRFIARKRVGGQVVVPEAIKILVIQ